MFYHVKELQFNARVEKPDPRFVSMLLEQFGGGNGELKAAHAIFCPSFRGATALSREIRPADGYRDGGVQPSGDRRCDHHMLLDGVNGELKNAAESNPLTRLMGGNGAKENLIHEAMVNPQFLGLSGGSPTLTNSQGVPWTASYVNANGDLTVDLRSDIAAESRAKIVYEYLLQFTEDEYVKETLRFLMTREIAHFQMFSAALETIQPNFPPGILQGDPRHTHSYFNMSNGADARGPWNEGQGPWGDGESWEYISDPIKHVIDSQGEINHQPTGSRMTEDEVTEKNRSLSKQRSEEVKSKTSAQPNQWSSYPQEGLESSMGVEQDETKGTGGV